MKRRRARVVAYAICLLAGLLVWNGIFGLLVSRGEKQYLLDQARHELGFGPEASLPRRMETTIHGGVREATRWGITVSLLGIVAVWVATRPRRDEDRPPLDE